MRDKSKEIGAGILRPRLNEKALAQRVHSVSHIFLEPSHGLRLYLFIALDEARQTMSDVSPPLPESALAKLFLDARTLRKWTAEKVDESVVRRLHELVALGPTANNSCPLRLMFVISPEAKEKLRPALDSGNVEKVMTAPVTAILAYDAEWWEQMSILAPGSDAKAKMLAQGPDKVLLQARNNAWLETGYLIIAARSLGLDAGPMIGFDPAKVDETFLSESTWRSFLLVNLGYGDRAGLRPRAPRLDFEIAARIV